MKLASFEKRAKELAKKAIPGAPQYFVPFTDSFRILQRAGFVHFDPDGTKGLPNHWMIPA